jgi:hypothetical protein
MDFRCWKGRAHQRGAAVGPQPWRHPNVRPTVTLGCETSCPGFFFSHGSSNFWASDINWYHIKIFKKK